MSPSARRYMSCRRKITHLTRKEAWDHARRVGDGNKCYPCSYCGHFHVGHPTRDPHLRAKRVKRILKRFAGKKARFTRAA